MTLDMPASADAFWQIYDQVGIRPEFLIVVLANESGLNPTLPNQAGAPYYGIGQNAGSFIQSQIGMTVDQYLQQPASFQLTHVVLPYFAGNVRSYGVPKSGWQLYQMEYCPGSLKWAPKLDDVITSPTEHTDCSYSANASFDVGRKGYITPRDLAAVLTVQANKQSVKDAIAAVYARRPWMIPEDPVYGATLLNTASRYAAIIVVAGAVASIGMTVFGAPSWAPRVVRKAFA